MIEIFTVPEKPYMSCSKQSGMCYEQETVIAYFTIHCCHYPPWAQGEVDTQVTQACSVHSLTWSSSVCMCDTDRHLTTWTEHIPAVAQRNGSAVPLWLSVHPTTLVGLVPHLVKCQSLTNTEKHFHK
jgi:hypothetical protein